MTDQTPQPPLDPQTLAAFADGELDAAARQRVLDQLGRDPQAVAALEAMHQLREATRRTMCDSTPPMSASLRARIEAQVLAGEGGDRAGIPLAPARERAAPLRVKSWARRVLGVAAMVGVAATVFVFADKRLHGSGHASDGPALSVNTVHGLTREHVLSCDHPEQLRRPSGFPVSDDEIATAVSRILGAERCPSLDLSSIGYHCTDAGLSETTGSQAVHLVYRPIDPKSRLDPLSVWVESDRQRPARLSFPADVFQATADNQTAEPVMYWHSDHLDFYLVSDSARGVGEAARLLAKRIDAPRQRG